MSFVLEFTSQNLFPASPPVLFHTVVTCYAYSHVLECTIFVLCVENLFFVFCFILVWDSVARIKCVIFCHFVISIEL
jgi:hypothetical protein